MPEKAPPASPRIVFRPAPSGSGVFRPLGPEKPTTDRIHTALGSGISGGHPSHILGLPERERAHLVRIVVAAVRHALGSYAASPEEQRLIWDIFGVRDGNLSFDTLGRILVFDRRPGANGYFRFPTECPRDIRDPSEYVRYAYEETGFGMGIDPDRFGTREGTITFAHEIDHLVLWVLTVLRRFPQGWGHAFGTFSRSGFAEFRAEFFAFFHSGNFAYVMRDLLPNVTHDEVFAATGRHHHGRWDDYGAATESATRMLGRRNRIYNRLGALCGFDGRKPAYMQLTGWADTVFQALASALGEGLFYANHSGEFDFFEDFLEWLADSPDAATLVRRAALDSFSISAAQRDLLSGSHAFTTFRTVLRKKLLADGIIRNKS